MQSVSTNVPVVLKVITSDFLVLKPTSAKDLCKQERKSTVDTSSDNFEDEGWTFAAVALSSVFDVNTQKLATTCITQTQHRSWPLLSKVAAFEVQTLFRETRCL